MNREENHSTSPAIGKSSLFGLKENTAGVLVGGAALAASFVPYASWFAWIIPAAAALIERKSPFAKVCDVQLFLCAAMISICSLITLIISPYAQEASGNRLMTLGAVGIIMSLLRVAGLVFEILTAYYSYKMELFEIPQVTLLIKKLLKYSKN